MFRVNEKGMRIELGESTYPGHGQEGGLPKRVQRGMCWKGGFPEARCGQ